MKRLFFLMATLAMVSLWSCEELKKDQEGENGTEQGGGNGQGDNGNGNGQGNNQDGPVVNPGTLPYPGTSLLSPEQQKANLKATATALMDEAALSQWKNDFGWLYNTIDYVSRLNEPTLEDAAAQRVEEFTHLWYSSQTGNPYSLYKWVIRLSEVTGHFVHKYGVVSYTPADDLQATLTNEDGEEVTVTFACDDSKSSPLLIYLEEDNEHMSSYEYYAYLPSWADLKILRGGKEFAALHLEFTPEDVDGDGILDAAKDKLGVTLSFSMAGFLLNLSQVQYTPEGAKMSALLTHNQKKVLGVEAQASFTVSQNYNFTPVSGSVALDLAGMTQVKADIPSYDKANSAFKDLEKGGGIAQLSAAAARLESSVNSAIYYGGCDVAQAKAGVDIVPIEGKQDGYKIVPMVRFGDGSSLAVDDYFSENNFGTLVTQMQNWLEEIERYIKSLQPLNIKL